MKWGQEVLCVVYNVFDANALASASGMPAMMFYVAYTLCTMNKPKLATFN